MDNKMAEQALNEVRKSFERWAPTAGMLIDRDKEGKYEQAMTRHYWLVWQAAKSDTEVAAVVMADPDGLSDLLAGKRDNATIYRTKNDWKAGVPLFARPALSAPRVPDGWSLSSDHNGVICVENLRSGESILVPTYSDKGDLWMRVSGQFFRSLLAASPEPVAQAREVVGITVAEATPDTGRCPECGMLDGHAEGCLDQWIGIPANLRRPSNMEQHAQQVISDLRAEVEALKAKNDALIDLSNGLDKMYRKLWKVIAQSVWHLAYRGEKDDVINALRESISDAARLREGGE